jgi:malate dehydrogenase (oxaloacetate-decarboxylating)(NADP+)
MGHDNKLLRRFSDMARQDPKRVVFAEGGHENMLRAAVVAKGEGICHPILLGNHERIEKLAKELELDLTGIEVINLRHDNQEERRNRYAEILTKKRGREGVVFDEAKDKMFERNYFGMMMVETGEADAFITGVYTKYSNTIKVAKEVIGIREGYGHFGTLHIITSQKGNFFLADTLINRHPSTEALKDIARLAHNSVRFFAHEPVMAMLSYSNFGTDAEGSPASIHEVVDALQNEHPDWLIDGEMQVNFALNKELRDRKYPFSKLYGKDVNTLIFPNLSSANIAHKLLMEMGVGQFTIGPIQMGLNKPVHFTDFESSVRDIVNITTVAVIDAIVQEQIRKERKEI